MKVIFTDRDGTVIRKPASGMIDSLEDLEFMPGAITGLKRLADMGYVLVMVTDQEGLGTPSYPRENFELVQDKILSILRSEEINFESVFVYSYTGNDTYARRKPDTELLEDFLSVNSIDKLRSYVVGDRTEDIELAKNIGCRSVYLRTEDGNGESDSADGNGPYGIPDYTAASFPDAVDYILRNDRTASVIRTTTETNIRVSVSLDGYGSYSIKTGVGFFDHMLEQIAKHSLIDIHLNVDGDLHIDEHHTVEDTGLALGECIRIALGDKKGIGRYGFVIPMDESQARIALDLGGRPFFKFDGSFTREKVGDFSTELVEDFFRAFADGMRANLHITVEGRNDHHKIEAVFKGVARSLREAVKIDPRAGKTIPSTKGML